MSVVWLLGLSGAGKTTLARALQAEIAGRVPTVILDGDAIREAVGDGLGFAEADRREQIGRLGRFARLLSEQGLVVIVAAVYSSPDLLAWNREHLPGYREVYLRASLDSLRSRDLKSLYRRALAGDIGDVVGVQIAWQPPQSPDLTLEMDDAEAPEVLARRVAALVPELAAEEKDAA